MSIFKFRRHYFIFAVLLFLTEIIIALFVHDRIVRPYIGDFLVVILIYCFIRSFLNIPVLTACICVLLFSYTIETLQYFNIVDALGLHNSKLANTVMGNSFAWMDIIAYSAGILAIFYMEKIFAEKQFKPKKLIPVP